MTVKAGYFTAVGSVDVNGKVSTAVVPDSLAYDSMDEDEYRGWFRSFHTAWVEKYGPQITHDELAEWAEM